MLDNFMDSNMDLSTILTNFISYNPETVGLIISACFLFIFWKVRNSMTTDATIVEPGRVMTVQDLIDSLNQIRDKKTPVYLEDGNPVHYTAHGMSQGGNKFFIGIL